MSENLRLFGKAVFALACGALGFIVTWNLLQPEYITKILVKIFVR